MPRGSASRSDTIVIGKPISSTRNIHAIRARGSLIPISGRLGPFYELETSVDRFNGAQAPPAGLKNMFTVFPSQPFPSFFPTLFPLPPLLPPFAALLSDFAAPRVVKTS